MTQEEIQQQIDQIDARIQVLNRKIKFCDQILWFLYTILAIWLGFGAYWALTGLPVTYEEGHAQQENRHVEEGIFGRHEAHDGQQEAQDNQN